MSFLINRFGIGFVGDRLKILAARAKSYWVSIFWDGADWDGLEFKGLDE